VSDAGQSTCPMCSRHWTVTMWDDCMVPACGCYGDEVSATNPTRPCESCGISHAWTCEQMPKRRGVAR